MVMVEMLIWLRKHYSFMMVMGESESVVGVRNRHSMPDGNGVFRKQRMRERDLDGGDGGGGGVGDHDGLHEGVRDAREVIAQLVGRHGGQPALRPLAAEEAREDLRLRLEVRPVRGRACAKHQQDLKTTHHFR